MATWQVGGEWIIHQNNGFNVTVRLTQNGDKVGGSASTTGLHSNRLEGSVTDTELHLAILWDKGQDGRYIGKFNQDNFPPDQGVLVGFTGDLAHPESSTKWNSENVIFRRK